MSNYSTRGNRSKLECAEKNLEDPRGNAGWRVTRKRGLPVQLLQHECYLLHILLRFHWISMRRCTWRLKLDQSSSKGKLESPSFPVRQFEWLSQKNILDTDPYIRYRLMQLKSGNIVLIIEISTSNGQSWWFGKVEYWNLERRKKEIQRVYVLPLKSICPLV